VEWIRFVPDSYRCNINAVQEAGRMTNQNIIDQEIALLSLARMSGLHIMCKREACKNLPEHEINERCIYGRFYKN